MYQPAEDSFFLEKAVKNYLGKKNSGKILDMGSGSGIQAQACIESGVPRKNLLCADIDKKAIRELKKKKLKTVCSDLFLNIKGKFNLIIFNPPYLPEDKYGYDKGMDTTGGKKGYEIILKFLRQAKVHLAKDGTIFLLVSSLSKPAIIKKEARKLGFKIQKAGEEKLFFEKLEVWKLFLV